MDNTDNTDEVYQKWWESKVRFARAVVAIEICLEYDDIQMNILDELHEIADNAEREYHKAFDAWLEVLEKRQLEVAAPHGNA
jgi:ribosome maturation protein Sdo1